VLRALKDCFISWAESAGGYRTATEPESPIWIFCLVHCTLLFPGTRFNFSEVIGNGFAAGIPNLYYTASDRCFRTTGVNWIKQIISDGLANVLKEFWPDIHDRMHHRKATNLSPPHLGPALKSWRNLQSPTYAKMPSQVQGSSFPLPRSRRGGQGMRSPKDVIAA
jgi:hypothetical protein